MVNYLKYLVLRYILQIATPKALIRLATKLHGNKTLFIDGQRAITTRALNDNANRVSHSLMSLGLKKGDKVAVWLQNSLEYIEIRLACYKCGFVFCGMIDDFDHHQVIELINELGCRVIIHDYRLNTSNIPQNKQESGPCQFVELGDNNRHPTHISYNNWLKSANISEPKIKTKPGEISAIGFTSGTTGKSKRVVWPHKAWLYSFYHFLLNSQAGATRNMVMLHVIPYSTAGSLSILPAIISGSLNIILKTFDAEKVAEAIDRYQITHLILPPGFLIDLWDYHLSQPGRFSLQSLKSITTGSAPLPAHKWKAMAQTFGPIITQSYGMAEVLAPISNLRLESREANQKLYLSVGKPVKQVKIKFKNTENNSFGTILLRSKTSCLGYWERGKICTSPYANKWFTSTDAGYMDAEGYLYIADRVNNISSINGQTFVAREIEEALHGFQGIKEAVVYNSQQTIKIAVSVLRNHQINPRELDDYCKTILTSYAIPVYITIADNLTHSTSGKIIHSLN